MKKRLHSAFLEDKLALSNMPPLGIRGDTKGVWPLPHYTRDSEGDETDKLTEVITCQPDHWFQSIDDFSAVMLVSGHSYFKSLSFFFFYLPPSLPHIFVSPLHCTLFFTSIRIMKITYLLTRYMKDIWTYTGIHASISFFIQHFISPSPDLPPPPPIPVSPPPSLNCSLIHCYLIQKTRPVHSSSTPILNRSSLVDDTLFLLTASAAGDGLESKPLQPRRKVGEYSTNTTNLPNVWPMLAHRLRRWPNISQTLGKFVVFAGYKLLQSPATGWRA